MVVEMLTIPQIGEVEAEKVEEPLVLLHLPKGKFYTLLLVAQVSLQFLALLVQVVIMVVETVLNH